MGRRAGVGACMAQRRWRARHAAAARVSARAGARVRRERCERVAAGGRRQARACGGGGVWCGVKCK